LGLKAWVGGSKMTFENPNFIVTKIITISHLTNYVTQCALSLMLMVKILINHPTNINVDM
jgi:hypothetical protein